MLRISVLTISDWISYLFQRYDRKLKPRFVEFIKNKLSDFIVSLTKIKNSDNIDKSKTDKSLHMSHSLPVTGFQ